MRKWVCGLLVVLCAVPLIAGTFTGKVKTVDGDNRTVVLEGAKNVGLKTFEVPEKVLVSVNGKKASFDSVSEGANVTIVTDKNDTVTKISVKGDVVAQAQNSKKPADKTAAADSGGSDAQNDDWAYFWWPERRQRFDLQGAVEGMA